MSHPRTTSRPRLVEVEDRNVPSTSTPPNTYNFVALGPAPAVSGSGGLRDADGLTVVAVTPTSNVSFGSLDDGRHVLTLLAGTANDGGFANAAATYNFHCLFGDANGDASFSGGDFGNFRLAFGASAGDPACLDYLDFEGNGSASGTDFGNFRVRFGMTVA